MKETEYNYIKRQMMALLDIDLNSYKAPQMQRRLKVYLARSGYPNWPKFFRAIRSDPAELSKLKDYLTINVSSFFRDSEKYKYLQTSILPKLLRLRASLRIWSAGCSRGQEAYSLAILLAEATGSCDRHRLLGTDIDRSALEWARAGGPYTADDIANVPFYLHSRYFNVRQNEYWIREDIRRGISFRQHNLLTDTIAGRFDMIVCRNVVIYFEPEAKEKLYRKFYDVLKPGGVLFVGGTEILPKPVRTGFEAINVSFYRRSNSFPNSFNKK